MSALTANHTVKKECKEENLSNRLCRRRYTLSQMHTSSQQFSQERDQNNPVKKQRNEDR